MQTTRWSIWNIWGISLCRDYVVIDVSQYMLPCYIDFRFGLINRVVFRDRAKVQLMIFKGNKGVFFGGDLFHHLNVRHF